MMFVGSILFILSIALIVITQRLNMFNMIKRIRLESSSDEDNKSPASLPKISSVKNDQEERGEKEIKQKVRAEESKPKIDEVEAEKKKLTEELHLMRLALSAEKEKVRNQAEKIAKLERDLITSRKVIEKINLKNFLKEELLFMMEPEDIEVKIEKIEENPCQCNPCPELEKVKKKEKLQISFNDQMKMNPVKNEALGAREYVEEDVSVTVKTEPEDDLPSQPNIGAEKSDDEFKFKALNLSNERADPRGGHPEFPRPRTPRPPNPRGRYPEAPRPRTLCPPHQAEKRRIAEEAEQKDEERKNYILKDKNIKKNIEQKIKFAKKSSEIRGEIDKIENFCICFPKIFEAKAKDVPTRVDNLIKAIQLDIQTTKEVVAILCDTEILSISFQSFGKGNLIFSWLFNKQKLYRLKDFQNYLKSSKQHDCINILKKIESSMEQIYKIYAKCFNVKTFKQTSGKLICECCPTKTYNIKTFIKCPNFKNHFFSFFCPLNVTKIYFSPFDMMKCEHCSKNIR